jgi:ankyrin repeat protein
MSSHLAVALFAALSPALSGEFFDWDVHHSIVDNNVDRLRFLVKEHPELANVLDTAGWTPLHTAAHEGRLQAAWVLLENRADPEGSFAHLGVPGTPLQTALRYGHHDIARLLLARGARLDICSAVGLGRVADVERFLEQDKTLLEWEDGEGSRPLHWATWSNQEPLVKLLLQRGAKASAQQRNGETPLHFAAVNGREQIVRALLKHGAEPNAKDARSETPLHRAVRPGNTEVVRLLLEAGATVECRDRFQRRTPLHLAAAAGDAALVELLICHKADPRAKDSEGQTPLDLWRQSPSNPSVRYSDLLNKLGTKAQTAVERIERRIMELSRRG